MDRPATLSNDTDRSLADLATTTPGAALVFHRHGLDFCCGGHTSLADACARAGLDPLAVTAEIAAAASGDAAFEPWLGRPQGDLIDHLLVRFHARHRAELPPLLAMAEKVEARHADKAACPRGLTAHLRQMAEELELHMLKEEEVLFPLLRQGRGHLARMPIQVMESEHEDHRRNLERLRSLAHDYAPPAEACATWTALYLGLAELERAIHQHVHLENNVLFPRALRG